MKDFEYILLPSLSQGNLLPYAIVYIQRAQGVENTDSNKSFYTSFVPF